MQMEMEGQAATATAPVKKKPAKAAAKPPKKPVQVIMNDDGDMVMWRHWHMPCWR